MQQIPTCSKTAATFWIACLLLKDQGKHVSYKLIISYVENVSDKIEVVHILCSGVKMQQYLHLRSEVD